MPGLQTAGEGPHNSITPPSMHTRTQIAHQAVKPRKEGLSHLLPRMAHHLELARLAPQVLAAQSAYYVNC